MTTSSWKQVVERVYEQLMEIKNIAPKFYDYSIHIKGYSKQTVRRYKYVIDLYCKISEVTELEKVSEADVRALLFHGRAERKWSANTAIIFHKSLFVFFRWCIVQGYIATNPVANIEKPKLEQKLPKKFTKQDALRLLDIVYNYPYEVNFQRYRNHAIFSMFIFAGLRRNELINLKFADVDTENFTIFISQGKGKKDRFVPISTALSQILNKYLEERKKRGVFCPEFFASVNNTGLSEHGLKHIVDILKKVSDLKFSVHKLRHTFATLMLEGGCDIYSLSKMMGHSDIKTTTIYLAASSEHLRLQMVKHPLNELMQ
jgi:site-specific recombinase XerD